MKTLNSRGFGEYARIIDTYNGVVRLWDFERDGELPMDENGDIDMDACEEQDIPVEFGDVLEYKHFLIHIKGDNIKVVDNT